MSVAEASVPKQRPQHVVGRYAVYGKLAAGGMATVHFGRLLGPVGFSRTVAIKRLHPQFAKDPEFVAMFLDEARVAARIQHPNVVATVDVVSMDQELFLVMDYIRGESFSRLLRRARKSGVEVPMSVVGSVVTGLLHGLHAAHDAKDERGQPLNLVHRDVSPQNVLVGVDGIARVLDFGVAKAAVRVQVTRDGQMKGKLSYMSPEQVQGRGVDRRSDVFAGAIVLWEALTGRRLFQADDASGVLQKLLAEPIPGLSQYVPDIPPEVEQVVLKGLAREPNDRYQSAREFAVALEDALQLASPRELGEWVEKVAGETLEQREKAVAEIESISSISEVSQLGSDAAFGGMSVGGPVGSQSQVRRGRPLPPPPRLPPGGVLDDAETSIYDSESSAGIRREASQLHPAPAIDPGPIDAEAAFKSMHNPWPLRLFVLGSIAALCVLAWLYIEQSETQTASETVTELPMPGVSPKPAEHKQGATSPFADDGDEGQAKTDADDSKMDVTDINELPKAKPSLSEAARKSSTPGAPAAKAPKSNPIYRPRVTGSSGRTTSTPANDCKTPYTIDEKGIKRIKPECL